MSLVGKYTNDDSGAVLEIAEANNANGQGKGNFILGEINIPVSIHYHFVASGFKGTTLVLSGFQDDPNHYVGIAGATDTTSGENGIRLSGGVAVENIVIPFSGSFKKFKV
ncbi:hypothetical protein KORDIASMS9_02752 [Kordia sp. SMS9]|uniref:hypothetical protein n=1 Tax=Kordia sp. SMS9 TaxID=2282170 RepID=UPI000E0DF34A|nr:hypothetical protein [Kordia sp. SMS9]AXG70512.1 hypothetical protein KORDIASMS9_02752 [Kordia sp. SMS9]